MPQRAVPGSIWELAATQSFSTGELAQDVWESHTARWARVSWGHHFLTVFRWWGKKVSGDNHLCPMRLLSLLLKCESLMCSGCQSTDSRTRVIFFWKFSEGHRGDLCTFNPLSRVRVYKIIDLLFTCHTNNLFEVLVEPCELCRK